MFSLFYLLFIIIIFEAEARGPDNEPVEITFKIRAEVEESGVRVICDELTDITNTKAIYTVLEGEVFKINKQYDSNIHHFFCNNYWKEDDVFYSYDEQSGSKNISSFMAERRLGGAWMCTVLVHPDHPTTFPKVQYKDVNYTAAYCYMWIHVRLRESPQTILVNNMALQTVRTDLSEKDVDFTAEYQYADGDIVNVTCVDLLNPEDANLHMKYSMADAMSDVPTSPTFDTYQDIAVGFIANLHSEHNNSYMICRIRQSNPDHTDVMVRFVMRTEFSTITVRINGMAVRPRKIDENEYIIDYKYESFHPINVVCEVQQTYMRLTVSDALFKVNNYSKTELIPTKKAEMSFYIKRKYYGKLSCVSSSITGGIAEETIEISFTAGNFRLNEYSLHITSSNGRSIDSYGQHRFIYYEYNDGETLEIQCGPFLPLDGNPYGYVSLNFGYSDQCREDECVLSKRFKVSHRDHNTKITCYLNTSKDIISVHLFARNRTLSEITVILRARVLTNTSTTSTTATSTTTTSPVTALTTATTTTSTAADPAPSSTSSSNTLAYVLSGVGGGVVVLILILVLYLLHKKRCWCLTTTSPELAPTPTPTPRPHHRTEPARYYENLLAVFRPINEREAMELEENHYEVVE